MPPKFDPSEIKIGKWDFIIEFQIIQTPYPHRNHRAAAMDLALTCHNNDWLW